MLAETTNTELYSVFANLATAGGFGALVWYLIVKEIPRQQDKFSQDLDKICETHKRVSTDQSEHCKAEVERIVNILAVIKDKTDA